jgi:uncharacterized protein YdaU (DUF1376 family)
MHYYQFNIKDYKAHTDHLSLMEDLAFRRMLDWVYLHEKPLPINPTDIAKRILMPTHSESIEFVLSEFFELIEDGYVNRTATDNIDSFKAKSEKATKSANMRWNKKPDANDMRTHSEGNANHKPLTTNNKPLTTNQLEEKTTPVKLDYSVLQMTKEQCDDVIRIRKKNKGPTFTQLIINQLAKQFLLAEQKGFTFQDSLIEWEVRGWKSFKADWMKVSQDSKPAIGKTQEIFNQLSEINYDRR